MSYISYLCSKWHKWFIEMGYPELDVLQYEDGEWFIIQYFRSPVVPALTQWQVVLGPMRNMDISYGFCAKTCAELDMTKRAFWDREEKATRAVMEEQDALDRHASDSANRAYAAIAQNPDLMDRIARSGIQEMDLDNIRRSIPSQRL